MNKQQTQLSQIKQIENHLLMYGKITDIKATTTYGIRRVASYICTLKNKRGWDIDPVRKSNSITWWVEYQLKNYPNS